MSDRVPMPRPVEFMAGDFAANISSAVPDFARRFSMTVAEEAIRKMGPMAVSHFTEKLAYQVVRENEGLIREAMLSYMRDRSWAEPLVREFLREAVREYVASIFTPNPITPTRAGEDER